MTDNRTGWYRDDAGQYIYLQDGQQVNPFFNLFRDQNKAASQSEERRKKLTEARKRQNKGRGQKQIKQVKDALSVVGDNLVYHPNSIDEYGKNLTVAQYNYEKKKEQALRAENFEKRTGLQIPEFKE